MVIYSGFSTRRQEQRYNVLVKQLLHLLSQMIISYVEASKAISFRQAYEKIQYEISKMDQQKYSDMKVSNQIEALTQHILNCDMIRQSLSEPPKKKNQNRPLFRMKRSNVDHFGGKTIDIMQSNQKQQKRRSFSTSNDKNSVRHSLQEVDPKIQLTMQELMRMNPLIERKMSGYRRKRYINQRNNNFPQIMEQDYEGEQKQ